MSSDIGVLLSDPHVETAVRRSELFTGLSSDDLTAALEIGVKVVFDKGEDLIVEGEAGTSFYVIESGQVEVVVRKGEGEERVNSLGAGSVLGEISMLTQRPRTATVRALGGRVTAFEYDESAFGTLGEKVPDIRQRLSRIAVPRVQETMRRLYA